MEKNSDKVRRFPEVKFLDSVGGVPVGSFIFVKKSYIKPNLGLEGLFSESGDYFKICSAHQEKWYGVYFTLQRRTGSILPYMQVDYLRVWELVKDPLIQMVLELEWEKLNKRKKV